MLITVGTKGPLPFFTILSSIYCTILTFVAGCYMCLLFIKKVGMNKAFQEKNYSKFFQAEFEASKKYPWLEKPWIKKNDCFRDIFILLYHGDGPFSFGKYLLSGW